MHDRTSAGPAPADLPDLSHLDVRALASSGEHPVLGTVAAALLTRCGTEEAPVAFYEDGIF
ncbi:YxD-tail cyclophane-containing RiPP peptide [Streptomyces sp. NPDC012751]|uniref:YxD-tail cyclophane-containing RiPP peptide n=1 Tax=unclassified Streptomyces TaxID=2593676 RepID=UPI0033F18B26